MDTNLRVVVSKEDSGLKELLESLGKLQSLFGGAIPAAVSKGMGAVKQSVDAIKQSASDLSKAQIDSSLKASEKVQAEFFKMAAAFDKAKQREIESEQKADEKIAALQAKEEARKAAQLVREEEKKKAADARDAARKQQQEQRAIAAQQKKEEREAAAAARSKGRTIAELNEKLQLEEKSRKEIVSLQKTLEEEISEVAKKLTLTLDGEEKKRLKATQAELKSELAAVKQEAEERGIASKPKEMDRKREFSAKGAMELTGIAVAVEGLNSLVEKSKEVVAAEHQLQVGTGLSGEALKKAGEEAVALGDKLGVSGDEAKTTMGKVASYTHATGEELNKQTAAVIAYAQAHGKSAEMVAKKLSTVSGQAEIFAEATENVGKAQEAANEPAIRAQLTQQKVEETMGELSSTLLQGIAPILTQIGPLFQDVGEIVGSVLAPALKLVSVVLTPLFEGLNVLKPILPELAIAIGVLTVAFNAQAVATGILNAVMAVNPFVWIAAAVLALIGIIVLLVKHWDEVIATTKKVFAAITDAGGAVLSFLGITSKAEAATKKHTKSLEENKKSLEDIKKAEEAAAKATSDYTDELKKNQEEQEKSAKEGQDNAIAAIVDIQKRLKTATGSEKALLQERLSQWQKYGKDQVAAQEEEDAAKEAASKSIGARVDKEDKSAMQAAKKTAKEMRDAKKNALDQELADRKDEIAAMDITDRQAKALQRSAEIQHQTALRDIYAEGSKEYIRENKKLQAILLADTKQDRADKLADAKTANENAIAAFNVHADEVLMSTKQREQGVYKLELQGLNDQLALVQKGSEEEAKLLQQRAAMEAKHNAEQHAREIATQKELAKGELDARKAQLEILKTSGVQASVILQEENAIAKAEEEQRYKEEKEARKDDLNDTKLGHALAESLETNHVNKLKAIDAQAAAQRKQVWMQNMQLLSGPITKGIMGGITQMTAGVHKLTQSWQQSGGVLGSIFGGILDSFVTMIEGMIEKIVAMEAILLVANLIPGFSAFMDMFQSFTSLVPTQATGLATGGVLKGATIMGAGVLTRPTFLASGGTMPIVAGEIPNEAVIPLNAYPGAKAMMQGDLGFSEHADRIIMAIQNSGHNVARAARETKIGIPYGARMENARVNYQKSEDRRSF